MSDPDLQFQFQKWLSDEREQADKARAEGWDCEKRTAYYAGKSQAFSECFAKLIEFIDIAKERDNG